MNDIQSDILFGVNCLDVSDVIRYNLWHFDTYYVK